MKRVLLFALLLIFFSCEEPVEAELLDEHRTKIELGNVPKNIRDTVVNVWFDRNKGFYYYVIDSNRETERAYILPNKSSKTSK